MSNRPSASRLWGDTTLIASAAVPAAPVIAQITPTINGAIILFNMPTNGGSPITQFTATDSLTSATFTSVATTTPAVAISCRIDATGLSNAARTFTVTATNANGTGAASAASGSVTPIAYAPYYVACGGSIVGENPLWGDYSSNVTYVSYNKNPGDASFAGGHTAPSPLTSGSKVIEIDMTAGQYGELLPFCINTNPAGGNGRFDTSPFTHINVAIWPTQSGQTAQIYFEASNWYNGVATGGGASQCIDANQNWPSGQFNNSPGGWLFNNLSGNSTQNIINTSTATALNIAAGGPVSAGNLYEIQQPDVSASGSVLLNNAAYGPATMTANAWNSYSVPLSAFGITLPRILKFAVQDQTGNATTIYFCNIGFS